MVVVVVSFRDNRMVCSRYLRLIARGPCSSDDMAVVGVCAKTLQRSQSRGRQRADQMEDEGCVIIDDEARRNGVL